MRSFDTSTLAALSNREGVIARQLVWIKVKNRSTGLVEPQGLWNGEDTQDFVINSEVRTYYGLGSHLRVPDIIAEVGIQVRKHVIELSGVAEEAAMVLREFDARVAPVEIHRVMFDLETRTVVSDPTQSFKGFMNKAPIPTAAEGAESTVKVEVASSARLLTRTLAQKKSDESQRLRSDDRFRQYGDVSGDVTTHWGEYKL